MLKSKCLSCRKRRKYGVEGYTYSSARFFRKIRKVFICFPCVGVSNDSGS